MTAAQHLILALLALVALGTAVGVALVPGRRWWDRQNAIDWETDDDRGPSDTPIADEAWDAIVQRAMWVADGGGRP